MIKHMGIFLVAMCLLAGCREQDDALQKADRRIAGLEAQVHETNAQKQEAAHHAAAEMRRLEKEKAVLEQEVIRLSAETERLGREIESLQPGVIEDTEYLVIKREHLPGQLIDRTPPTKEVTSVNNPYQTRVTTQSTRIGREWERTNPVWRIYLRGVQTKRDYPPLEIKESEYKHFIEGAVCTRADLNRAKVR